MTHQPTQEQLEAWHWENEGTGTEACKTCRQPDHICAWHLARLRDLEDIITALIQEAVNEVLGANEAGRYDRLTAHQKQILIDYHTKSLKELSGGSNNG